MVYTGLAFAYNASVGWFGGTTPLIAAMLIAQTGDPISFHAQQQLQVSVVAENVLLDSK